MYLSCDRSQIGKASAAAAHTCSTPSPQASRPQPRRIVSRADLLPRLLCASPGVLVFCEKHTKQPGHLRLRLPSQLLCLYAAASISSAQEWRKNICSEGLRGIPSSRQNSPRKTILRHGEDEKEVGAAAAAAPRPHGAFPARALH